MKYPNLTLKEALSLMVNEGVQSMILTPSIILNSKIIDLLQILSPCSYSNTGSNLDKGWHRCWITYDNKLCICGVHTRIIREIMDNL